MRLLTSSVDLAVQRDHLNRGNGGFKALVSCFKTGAIKCLFKGFTGENAERMWDARLLLRLADAARDFGVNSLIMRSLTTKKHAQGDDGIKFSGFSELAGRGEPRRLLCLCRYETAHQGSPAGADL